MRWPCLSVVAVLVFFSACGPRAPKETPADRAAEAGILLRGNGEEPESLDPHLATSVSAGNILTNLFEGLTRLDPKTLRPEPAMAERWDVSPDGRIYTFYLRDAPWSDGKRVRASDFVYAFRRLLRPELGASYAFMLFPLQHAEAIHRGEMPVDRLGVEAVDDRTLRVTLERPTPYFLSLLAHWTAFPLPRHVLESLNATTDRSTGWTRKEHLVSNGPFSLEEWVAEDVIRVRKNPNYWEAESVSLAGAEFRPYKDASTEERAFRGGELHVTFRLPRSRLPHYRANAPDVLRVDPYLESNAYVVNLSHPVLADPRVRRALSLALDRDVLTRTVLYDVREPAFTYVPPGTAGFHSEAMLEENRERARALLAEAGYSEGTGVPELDLIISSGQDTENVAQVVQQQWKEALGIRVSINNLERKTYFSRRSEGDFDLCVLGWVGDYVDPLTFLGLWRTDAGNNLAGWSNETYDRLLNRAATAGEDRMSLLARAEALLLEELPVIPLYFGATQYLKDPRVRGWHPNLLDHHPLRAVEFAEQVSSPK